MGNEFWVDNLAKKAMARAQEAGTIVTCRSGQSPSGAKHIGNINDNIRSYFVAKRVNDLGGKARHVQTHDDMDPFRKLPSKIADLDGNWQDITSHETEMAKFVGTPLCHTPDPLGCCDSWAHHFEKLWENGCNSLGLETEYYRNENLYKEGKFDPFIKMALERAKLAGRTIAHFQKSKPENYIPLNVICERCGKLTGRVTNFDLDAGTVDYICEERKLAGKYGTGVCGNVGTVKFGGGNCKLPWRFEWPAQWIMFETTLEPFGKDHYEGSWPSGKVIVEKIFDGVAPIPVVYEFFLVNGKKMSTRHGNVFITQEMLKLMTPAEFLHFYTKRPEKQRDLDITNIFRLVDEYDATERIYFGTDKTSEKEASNAKGRYTLCTKDIPVKQPMKLAYQFSSMLDQSWEESGREQKVAAQLEGASQKDLEFALRRLNLAGNWARTYADDGYKLNLAELDKGLISEDLSKILSKTADAVESGSTADEILNTFRNGCKEAGIPAKESFSAVYKLLIGKEKGPRLGTFLLSLDKEWVVKRLRLEA